MDVACCAAAGILARIPCHPLDTCKTVAAAAEGGLKGSSIVPTALAVYRREGVRGFYRGVGIASLGAAPGNAVYITSYEYFRWLLPQYTGGLSLTVDSPLIHLAAGLGAEAFSCVIWLPIDVVKERLQTQDPSVNGRYRNSVDGIVRVARNEGLRGLYKGYLMTLGSFGPYSAIYFMTFELYKRLLFGLQAKDHPHAYQSGVSGFFANATACVLTQPLEVVKTRYQIQKARLALNGPEFNQFSYEYTGLRNGLVSIFKQDGAFGLWRGVGARIMYQAPNAALTFALVAKLKNMFGSGAQ